MSSPTYARAFSVRARVTSEPLLEGADASGGDVCALAELVQFGGLDGGVFL
jgi:hypothetical protein